MRLLTDDQLDRINDLSLRLLEEVGLRIDHEEISARLLDAGCRKLVSGHIAFPRGLVADYLARAPHSVRLAAHGNGETVDVCSDGPTVFWTGNALNLVVGREAHAIREDDFIALTRVADALHSVHAAVGPANHDLPAQYRDFVACRMMAEHTGKHLRPCIYTPRGGRAICEMGEVLASPRPLRDWPVISFGYTAVSPLHWTEPGLELFVQTSGYGAPMMVNAEPTAGATAPVTVGGALMLANAEALGGVVILQLLEPGRPVIFNLGFAHAMDMRQAVTRTGGPENGLLHAAGAQLAAFHNLPSAAWMSTESMVADEQAAYEKMTTGLMQSLGGVSVIWGIGQLESQRTMSLEQMVVDDEIARVCLRASRPIATDDDSLAYDLVAGMGSDPQYLGDDHTLARFRDEIMITDLGFVGWRESWQQAGAKTAIERASDRVADILAAEPTPHVSDDKLAELLEIESRWREMLA